MCVGMCVCVHMSGYTVCGKGKNCTPQTTNLFFTPFLLSFNLSPFPSSLSRRRGGGAKERRDGGREEKRCRSMMGREWGEKMVDKIDCGMWDVGCECEWRLWW